MFHIYTHMELKKGIFTYFSNLSQIINDRQLKLYVNKRINVTVDQYAA